MSLLDPNSKLSDKSSPRMTTTTKEINLKTVDSKIITCQHVELISKWIGKLVIADNVKILMNSNYYFADLVIVYLVI